jgi:hypothetical protein
MSAISVARAPSHAFESRLIPMATHDDELHIQPGRIQHGTRGAKRPKSFVGEVTRAAKKAGHIGKGFGRAGRTQGRSTFGRGRRAALSMSSLSPGRRVVVMTRIVRHQGKRFRPGWSRAPHRDGRALLTNGRHARCRTWPSFPRAIQRARSTAAVYCRLSPFHVWPPLAIRVSCVPARLVGYDFFGNQSGKVSQ